MGVLDKPGLPPAAAPGFGEAVRACLNRIMGRQGAKALRISGLQSSELTGAPAAADYNRLRADVELLRQRYNSLIDQIGDP